MFGMQEVEVHQHQVQQSGVVRAEVHQGGAGSWDDGLQVSGICGRCGKQSSLPAGCVRPQGLTAAAAVVSQLLFVRKDLSLVSFSAQPDQHPG